MAFTEPRDLYPNPGPPIHPPNTSLSRLQHPAKESPESQEDPIPELSSGAPFRGQQPMWAWSQEGGPRRTPVTIPSFP